MKTVQILQIAQEAYTNPLELILRYLQRAQAKERPNAKSYAKNAQAKFRQDLQTLFDQSLSFPRFYNTLSFAIYDVASEYAFDPDVGPDTDLEKLRLATILDGLSDVGLGGDKSQRALARAMERLLSSYLESRWVAVDWFGKSSVTAQLRDWVKNRFECFGRWALSKLEAEGNFSDTSEPEDVQKTETRYWQDIAIGRLGMSRVQDLFEYVKGWDQSIGAIRDLKVRAVRPSPHSMILKRAQEYIITPITRSHVTATFISQLHNRLLIPAVATLDILNIYISVIKVFLELDSNGVLLDRVARPIRLHLKLREDAIRIIVESCLAEFNEEGDPVNTASNVSSRIAMEMNHSTSARATEDHDLDWADMDWVPEPLDAEPGYRRVKSEGILNYLSTLFDREDFIKELQTILADYLLHGEDTEYEKEIRLLELLKALRFSADKLQACEVMLKDVQDSKRISATINDHSKQSFTLPVPSASLHTKILSSFFWPSLREQEFRIPREIRALQDAYAERFESVKHNRKLKWLNAQGRVTVSLDFEDRTVTERNVQTYQAAVIHAFQEPNPHEIDGPATRTVEMLQEALEMDKALVLNALKFWVGKLILREVETDSAFTVLERLDDGAGDREAAAAAAAAAAGDTDMGVIKSQQDRFGEKRGIYTQFVTMMLTNSGNKPTAQIHMMMKTLVQGGFPFSEEDLRDLLSDMVEQGALINTGGDVYGIRR